MARKTQVEYVTIKGRLKFDNKEDKAMLLYTMRVFKESVERAYVLLKKGVEDQAFCSFQKVRFLFLQLL